MTALIEVQCIFCDEEELWPDELEPPRFVCDKCTQKERNK